jgi:hypothetical protein
MTEVPHESCTESTYEPRECENHKKVYVTMNPIKKILPIDTQEAGHTIKWNSDLSGQTRREHPKTRRPPASTSKLTKVPDFCQFEF